MTPSPAQPKPLVSSGPRSKKANEKRTRNTNDVSDLLSVLDNLELVLRTRASEDDFKLAEDLVPLPSLEGVDLVAVDNDRVVLVLINVVNRSRRGDRAFRREAKGARDGRDEPASALRDFSLRFASNQVDLASDRLGRLRVVSGNHHDLDTRKTERSDRLAHTVFLPSPRAVSSSLPSEVKEQKRTGGSSSETRPTKVYWSNGVLALVNSNSAGKLSPGSRS